MALHLSISKKKRSLLSLKKAKLLFSKSELPGLAQQWAQTLKAGDVLLLEGPLGTGKTTVCEALIGALSGSSLEFKGSPTFPILWEYPLKTLRIAHVDLYRLKTEQEWTERGIEELFLDSKSLFLIEWASLWPNIEKWIHKNACGKVFHLQLKTIAGTDQREIEIR